MSRDDSTNNIPFGYFFNDLATGASTSSYPPPTDRPLLLDAENSFLESFFNDPNNIDALASMPSDYQGEQNTMYGNPNIDWTNSTTGEYSNSSTHNHPTTRQRPLAEWQPATYGLQPDLSEPSADVYAAAGILHNNNNTSRSQNDSHDNKNNFAIQSSNSGPVDNMNGYTYPPLNPSTGSPYNFDPASQAANSLYELNARFEPAENATTPYLATLQNRLGTGSSNPAPRPAGPLAFGSDDNFRGSYAAPPGETPEKILEDAITHNFADNSKAHRQRRAPTAAMRKRARAADEDGISEAHVEDATFEDEDGASKRRRKDGDDDSEEFENGTSSKGKKGKRRQTSATVAGTEVKDEVSSPGKKARASTSNPKSNRENLTEEQKRNNHIQSEQKRRNLIKQGFDDLNRMVPDLRSGSLSKSNMLVESAKFMRSLKDQNDELRAQLQGIDKG